MQGAAILYARQAPVQPVVKAPTSLRVAGVEVPRTGNVPRRY
jgi:hypothetical protein